jgi:hypothetical protein
MDGAVNGPTGGFEWTAATIFAARVAGFGLEHPHAVVVVVAIVGGEVDEPFAVDEMEFGRPDVIGIEPR